MATISPSTAACECGFSAMSREKTSLLTSLKDNRLEDILWICVNGELLEKFDSRRSLEMWLWMAKNTTSEDIDLMLTMMLTNLMLSMKMD